MKQHIPFLFNYFIITVYLLNCLWWAYFRSWADVGYWLSAASITAVVTFGYTRT